MDEHIGDNQNRMTEVNLDIATLRREMEERVMREILDKLRSLPRTVSTENKVMDEKLDGITTTVNDMNLRGKLIWKYPTLQIKFKK